MKFGVQRFAEESHEIFLLIAFVSRISQAHLMPSVHRIGTVISAQNESKGYDEAVIAETFAVAK